MRAALKHPELLDSLLPFCPLKMIRDIYPNQLKKSYEIPPQQLTLLQKIDAYLKPQSEFFV